MIGFFLGIKKNSAPIDWTLFLKVILCMVFARTAAMAYNRYADRKIDAKNERTKTREIPSGKISASSSLALVIFSCVLFIITTYFINTLCFYLSPVALLLVLGYSLTKRFTWLCHLVLGLGLSLAPMGAYLAVTAHFYCLPLFFSFGVIFWVSGFDIIYALQDEEFDKEEKLFSIPALLGKSNALRVSELLHLFAATFIIVAGLNAHFGFIYWTGALVFITILIYQHTLVKPNDLSRVNLAFATLNGIASVVFACFTVAELILR